MSGEVNTAVKGLKSSLYSVAQKRCNPVKWHCPVFSAPTLRVVELWQCLGRVWFLISCLVMIGNGCLGRSACPSSESLPLGAGKYRRRSEVPPPWQGSIRAGLCCKAWGLTMAQAPSWAPEILKLSPWVRQCHCFSGGLECWAMRH